MKIRTDFVTNSSSTSFVVITPEEFKKEHLFRLVGIEEDSPLAPLFDLLYSHMRESLCSPDEYLRKRQRISAGLREGLSRSFPEAVVSRIVAAYKQGHVVSIGDLSSDDGDVVEAFFCMDSFEIEDDDLYLNVVDCAW